MLKKCFDFYKKYKQVFRYLFFGACTTILNTLVYGLLYEVLGIHNVISTLLSNIISVIFAFITNKLLVFESKSTATKEVLPEAVSFFGWRIATGILDIVIMFIAVDVLERNSVAWKLISNVLIIVINFIVSKWVVFKDKRKR